MGKVFYDKDEKGLQRRVVDVDSKLVLLAECDKKKTTLLKLWSI